MVHSRRWLQAISFHRLNAINCLFVPARPSIHIH
uniref:Uncharacterized protein n=1 Tax=Arundo donax TaxID=35708 RepID=A0A0A9HGA1_ARUDO